MIRLATTVTATVLLLSVPACTTETQDQEAVAAEAITLSSSYSAGSIVSGQSVAVPYTGNPTYRMLSLEAKADDAIDVTGSVSSGEGYLFLLDAQSRAIVPRSSGSFRTEVRASGTYFIVFRERDLKATTFRIGLKITKPTAVPPAPTSTTPPSSGMLTVPASLLGAKRSALFSCTQLDREIGASGQAEVTQQTFTELFDVTVTQANGTTSVAFSHETGDDFFRTACGNSATFKSTETASIWNGRSDCVGDRSYRALKVESSGGKLTLSSDEKTPISSAGAYFHSTTCLGSLQ